MFIKQEGGCEGTQPQCFRKRRILFAFWRCLYQSLQRGLNFGVDKDLF